MNLLHSHARESVRLSLGPGVARNLGLDQKGGDHPIKQTESVLVSTCAGSLLVEVTLLLSTFSSSSCALPLPPFLKRFDWHCTSVRRPGEDTKCVFLQSEHI